MKFHQINIREIKKEIYNLKKISLNNNNITIGLEITTPDINKFLTINIDPQHNMENGKITCAEKVLELLPLLAGFCEKNIYIYFQKTDLDSILAGVILENFFKKKIEISCSVFDRIDAIIQYDRHGRIKTSKTKIPHGLFTFVSGWKNNLIDKINCVKSWIFQNNFINCQYYNRIANNNYDALKKESKLEIIIPQKVIFVKASRRGACGLGYRFAPIVIALNPSYRFGFGNSRVYGKRWIIAQKNSGYLNFQSILNELNEIESFWGGSETIIGSPQEKPSILSKDDIIDILLKKF